MSTKIAVAGATGELGRRITKSLLQRGAEVVAPVRAGSAGDKVAALRDLGARAVVVDTSSVVEVTGAIAGAACLVSAVQGLRDVIVGVQSVLLESAIAAGIPRFIPSDFSTDFTRLPAGENRNFDLRKEFHERLDVAPLASTAIFNGAFGEILTYNTPLLDLGRKVVQYWGDPDWRIDFTTMDDTAAYTAAAALDPATPRALRIAGFQVTPSELRGLAEDALKTPFRLERIGSLEELSAHNKKERSGHPEGEGEIYPSWQRSQYLHSMFSVHHESLDNGRYPDIAWQGIRSLLERVIDTGRG